MQTGVILCHTGAGTEGLDFLHRLEKFVKKSEPHPTLNRVLVMQSLSAAYEAEGDFLKSRKYNIMAHESIEDLRNRMNPEI